MNARQKRFVAEYLIDLNATQAAIRAGYSQRSAHEQGSKLLTDFPDIAAAVQKGMDARAKRTRITQDRVLEELSVVSFSSVADYEIDEDGHVKLKAGVRPEAIRAISSIKRKTRSIPQKEGSDIVEVETEIKLWSKPDTLRMCGQHLGMFADREPPLSPSEVAGAVRAAIRAMNESDGLADAA